jgi:hypothetical protein
MKSPKPKNLAYQIFELKNSNSQGHPDPQWCLNQTYRKQLKLYTLLRTKNEQEKRRW